MKVEGSDIIDHDDTSSDLFLSEAMKKKENRGGEENLSFQIVSNIASRARVAVVPNRRENCIISHSIDDQC